MTADRIQEFDKPMRQAPAGLWIEGYKTLKAMYKIFGLYLLYLLIKSPGRWELYLSLILIFFLVIFFYGWLSYRSVVFYIDSQKGEFIFKRGVFTKRQIDIQIDRIQQVNLTRHVIQKLLNVYAVEINTAGSKDTEIVIHAMKLQDALELKKKLLEAADIIPEAAGIDHDKTGAVKLSNSTVFKIALTSRYAQSLGILIAAWGALYNTVQDIFRTQGIQEDEYAEVALIRLLLASTWFLVSALILFWVLFNIANGFIRFYNYHFKFSKGTLQIEYGMIKNNHVIIQDNKVQSVDVITNYFQRKMNLSRLIFKQASADFHSDKKAAIEIPGCSKSEKDEILYHIFKRAPRITKILVPDPRKMIPPVLKLVLIPLVVLLLFYRHNPTVFYAFSVWALFVFALSYFSYRNNKLMIADDFILVQHGAWDVSVSMMESYKIQGVKITQRLWHRKAGIAHVTIYTAADDISFRFAKLSEVNQCLNKWLYDAEASGKGWM